MRCKKRELTVLETQHEILAGLEDETKVELASDSQFVGEVFSLVNGVLTSTITISVPFKKGNFPLFFEKSEFFSFAILSRI